MILSQLIFDLAEVPSLQFCLRFANRRHTLDVNRYGDRAAQLPRGISPYVDDTNTTLLAGVWGGDVAPAGAADDRVGSYDWRMTMTDSSSNAVPVPEPVAYDPAEFELLRRAIARGLKFDAPGFSVPNRKTDWKMFGTFGEHPNYQVHVTKETFLNTYTYTRTRTPSLAHTLTLTRLLNSSHSGHIRMGRGRSNKLSFLNSRGVYPLLLPGHG